MTLRLFGEVLVTMLVILDPPGNVPIFLAVTRQLSEKERNRAAFLAIGTAFLVIVLFAFGGETILDYLHVSVPALQGAGACSYCWLRCNFFMARVAMMDTLRPRRNSAHQSPWFPSARRYSLVQEPSWRRSCSLARQMVLMNRPQFCLLSQSPCLFQ